MDFVLAVLGLSYVYNFCDANSFNSAAKNLRANEQIMVNEAFMEQKDVLLEMLELKLKEVRDKKKKKSNGKLDHAVIAEPGGDSARSAELKLTANGISAVGEMEGRLSFGRSGKSNLKLIAEGISNIGKTNLDLAVENGNVYIPGFSNLFLGTNCVKHLLGALGSTDKKTEPDSRRIVPGFLKPDNSTENTKYKAIGNRDNSTEDTKYKAIGNRDNSTENTKYKAIGTEIKDTTILVKGNETQVKVNETLVKGNEIKVNGAESQSNAHVMRTLSETAVTNLTVVNTEPTTVSAAANAGPAAS